MQQLFQILIYCIFILLFSKVPVLGQNTFETEIETVNGDTIKGVLKNGERFSGHFVDRDDLLPFEENLQKGFEHKGERFDGELPVHYSNFEKSVDVQIRKSIIEYKEGNIEGKYIAYDWGGSIIFSTSLKNGKIDGEYTSYYKYQEKGLQPFAIINFVDGKKEGKIDYTDEDGNKIGEGIYKNDLPFNGQFFNSKMDFQTYENAKLHGKRVERIQNVDVSFWVEEGKENSVYPFKTYDREASVFSVFVEGVYENGIKKEGQFFDHQTNEVVEYKDWSLVRKILISETGGECFIIEYNEKGVPLKVQLYTNDDRIDLHSDSLRYVGIYKNGKPFEGDFFEKDINLHKLLLHKHYKKGVLQFKTYLRLYGYWTLEGEMKKAIFKNGIIADGMDIEIHNNLVIQKEYDNGQLQKTTFNNTYDFPFQEKIETLKVEANGYAIYNHENQLTSKVTYRSDDKSSGTITYFKDEEKGSIDFENNQLTNGAFTWPAIIGKKSTLEINIESGIRSYKETLFDLYYFGEEAIDTNLPIIYHAVLPPYNAVNNGLITYWVNNDEKLCELRINEGKENGIIIFSLFNDSYILEVFKDSEKVEELTIKTKEEIKQLVKKYKEEYLLE